MRNAFAETVTELAEADKRVVLLSGDIGNRLFDRFRDLLPGRFYNCGIAEANMAGVAAGLAMTGMRPVTYTITPFNTTRCLEQIKLDICCQNLPVIIVGTGSGLSYSNLGPTHHSFEDIAILRALPNMMIVCPADVVEVRLALIAALNQTAPVFIRLGKKKESRVHRQSPAFEIGRSIEVRSGRDCSILGLGNMVAVALDVAAILDTEGVDAQVFSFHTVKPLDENTLQHAFSEKRLVVTLEEHSIIGGLGGAVAEWLADHSCAGYCPLLRLGIPDEFIRDVGGQMFVRHQLHLSPERIVIKILAALSKGFAASQPNKNFCKRLPG